VTRRIQIFLRSGQIALATLALPGRIRAADPAPTLVIRTTPCGIRYGIWPGIPTQPAPTLFIFTGTLEDSLTSAYYRQAGDTLAKQGWLLVSIDLPAHGQERRPDEPKGIPGWSHRLAHGENLVAQTTAKLHAVLDDLIAQKFTEPSRVAALGTSRGGFIALHFTVADARIRAVAGFAPVTKLTVLTEFKGEGASSLAESLSLDHFADRLAGRACWLVIGDRDERVGTDDAIRLARKITASSLAQKLPALVELHVVSAPKGHTVPPGWAEQGAEWFARQMSAPLITGSESKSSVGR
jgi:dienelactone hydrolase